MVNKMLTEDLVMLSNAHKLIPAHDGKEISRSTLWRWALKGRRGVKLECIIIGSRRFTTAQAITRFIEAINEADTAGAA